MCDLLKSATRKDRKLYCYRPAMRVVNDQLKQYSSNNTLGTSLDPLRWPQRTLFLLRRLSDSPTIKGVTERKPSNCFSTTHRQIAIYRTNKRDNLSETSGKREVKIPFKDWQAPGAVYRSLDGNSISSDPSLLIDIEMKYLFVLPLCLVAKTPTKLCCLKLLERFWKSQKLFIRSCIFEAL